MSESRRVNEDLSVSHAVHGEGEEGQVCGWFTAKWIGDLNVLLDLLRECGSSYACFDVTSSLAHLFHSIEIYSQGKMIRNE